MGRGSVGENLHFYCTALRLNFGSGRIRGSNIKPVQSLILLRKINRVQSNHTEKLTRRSLHWFQNITMVSTWSRLQKTHFSGLKTLSDSCNRTEKPKMTIGLKWSSFQHNAFTAMHECCYHVENNRPPIGEVVNRHSVLGLDVNGLWWMSLTRFRFVWREKSAVKYLNCTL